MNSYHHSKEFKQEFESNKNAYRYFDSESDKELPYDSLAEYIDFHSYVFNEADGYGVAPGTNTQVEMSKYEPDKNYYSSYSGAANFFAIIMIATAGFLLFFVDQKTAFNRYLFGLPVTRKELFRKKFTLVGSILFGSLFVSQLLYCIILYFGIPQPYMNVTFGTLILSALQCFSQQIFLFTASAFIGSMVGNLLFGPITWLVFFFFSALMTEALRNFLDTLSSAHIKTNLNPQNLLIESIGKNQGYWFVPVCLLLAAFACYLWGEKKYRTLSLEYDGDYLLHRESRWGIWAIMTVYSLIIALFYYSNNWQYYFITQETDYAIPISTPIWQTIVMLLLCGGISFVIIFFSTIKAHFRQWRERRTIKKVA